MWPHIPAVVNFEHKGGEHCIDNYQSHCDCNIVTAAQWPTSSLLSAVAHIPLRAMRQLWLSLAIILYLIIMVLTCADCSAPYATSKGLKQHRNACKARKQHLQAAAHRARIKAEQQTAAKIQRRVDQDIVSEREAVREALNKVRCISLVCATPC